MHACMHSFAKVVRLLLAAVMDGWMDGGMDISPSPKGAVFLRQCNEACV